MADLLKTWPAFMSRDKVLRIFTHDWRGKFFWFNLGRGKPRQEIERLYFTHQDEVIGHFIVDEIVCNLGDNIPKLRSLQDRVSEWQIKRDNFVARCAGPFVPVPTGIFYSAFRGYRYFDFDSYSKTPESRIAL